MANPFFQFKQFIIRHDKCAMKVGTDGVLLGAWANTGLCRSILDVGTGTGLIALMLAQRSTALIDAIDIDADACTQAVENATDSPFAGRIRVVNTPLADYTAGCQTRYDLIMSNPPYFSDSLKCPNGKRSIARHTDALPLPELIKDCCQLLAPNGRIALILPSDQSERLLSIARLNNLYLCRRTDVLPLPDTPPRRMLIELASNQTISSPVTNSLVIEIARHQYSEEYKTLTRDFYLKM